MGLRKLFFCLGVLVSFCVSAQGNDTAFQKEWADLDSVWTQRNLSRAALEKAELIYQRAKQRSLPAQVIKALYYKIVLSDGISENEPGWDIASIKKEISTATDPVQKAILYSFLAKRYQQYYDINRWTLYNRKTVTGIVKDDIATWSIDDLVNAIRENYLLSLKDPIQFQHYPVTAYQALIVKGNNTNNLTLFDLLAREALQFFKSADYQVTKPAELFTINKETALSKLDDFIKTPLVTNDSTAAQWIALDLFRQLLSFHKTDMDKSLLVQWNIERIDWVNQHAFIAGKPDKYRDALLEMAENYSSVPASAEAWWLLAKMETEKASRYQPFGDTANRYAYNNAETIIQKAIALYDPQYTGNLQNLLLELRRPELSTRSERVNIPDKPFRTLVVFRNTDMVFGRIIKITAGTNLTDNYSNFTYWNKLNDLKTYRSFQQALPLVNDHQSHSAEIKTDALPIGEYLLLISNSSAFDPLKDRMSAQMIYVSNISYIKNGTDFFVLDRDNGKPVRAANIVIYKNDLRNARDPFARIGTKKTDEHGYFKFSEETTGAYRYEITKGKDRLFLQQNDYQVYQNTFETSDEVQTKKYEATNSRVIFFTDRGIYRPGQTVLYKGIGYTKDGKTKQNKLIISTEPIWVYLNDVNQQKIDSAKCTLNGFGSFTGSFQIPQNLLTGNFSISVPKYNGSATYFSVEEYKRPAFSVSFEKPKGAYRLNDSLFITGTVKGYAGNRIDAARVVYNVTRNTRYRSPLFYDYRRPAEMNRAIMHGETTTDANGNFTVGFKALAGDLDTSAGYPLFDFNVSASVTDNSGETRTANTRIITGFKSILLNLTVPAVAEVDSFKKITVYAANLSEEKEPATITLKIYRLQLPDHPVRKRLWARPDQFVMNRKEFTAAFPTDEFEQESNYRTWNTNGLAFETTVNTKEKEFIELPQHSLPAGYYKVEASSLDSYGQPVKTEQYLQLFDRNDLQTSLAGFQFSFAVKNTAQPGETASFISGSAAPRIYMIRKTDKPTATESNYEYTEQTNKPVVIRYTPVEADRGGVFITETYVYDNRFYTNQYAVYVPWTNKVLDIKYSSYRDKTEPGNNEKWSVTVQTDRSEKAAAELLTGMYDASLDQFRNHAWQLPSLWETMRPSTHFLSLNDFAVETGSGIGMADTFVTVKNIIYDQFIFSANNMGMSRTLNGRVPGLRMAGGALDEVVTVGYGNGTAMGLDKNANPVMVAELQKIAIRGAMAVPDYDPGKSDTGNNIIQPVRTNFSETAFFIPQLYADSSGQYSFSFTMPDALTQWKWMSLAHTKDLAFGASSTTVITQKKLMVQSNAPRFMREGDNMEFSTKISNLDDKEITGQVSFELLDPETNSSVDGWFQNVFPSQYFTVAAGQSFAVKFPIQIPFNYNRPLRWRVVARSGNMSDGEENVLPVLTNRVLITESLPLFLQNDTTKQFRFDKLLNNKSESLTNESLTVEYTTNPAWYAVKSLPYLIEFPYECAEQTFNRFYANTLAAYIVNKQPLIKKIFEEWKKDSSSLQSNLQKNEELKLVILQETPWVMQGENEATQRKNLAMLFDMASLTAKGNIFIEKLQQQQLPSGGFSWFNGGNEDRYITNYILTGIGKLKRLGALTPDLAMRIRTLLGKAAKYMDEQVSKDYSNIIKNKSDSNLQQVGTTQIEYLYMRSFFNDIALSNSAAWQYFYKQAKKYWIKQNTYSQAQIGLVAFRNRDDKFATGTILPSLLENTVIDTKQGMYWKNAYTNWWYQSPVEHQSMMIAFMSEIAKDQQGGSLNHQLNAMRTWLLLNKQATNWRTTIATADACYALLLNGTDWLATNKRVTIRLGDYLVSSNTDKTEAGTGYLKNRVEGRLVKPEMGNISITTSSAKGPADKKNAQPSWGSVYWQYFENMDNVTGAGGPLSVTKKLFIEKNTNKGKQLNAVKDGEELKIGDKVVIRMELRSDRDMDYLHLKDTRAAGMEPVNVLSGYRWRDGLGYYESTKDASSNFFIDHLHKGTYVFEYPVFISHAGIFSAGIATIQCMYAPEFTAHSEGLKVRVADQ